MESKLLRLSRQRTPKEEGYGGNLRCPLFVHRAEGHPAGMSFVSFVSFVVNVLKP
jgi:hypothetical protein